MRIGLLTFIQTNNYGAMLQGYASTRYLESLGHEVIIINVPLLKPGAARKTDILGRVNGLFASANRKLQHSLDKKKKQSYFEKLRMNLDADLQKQAKEYDKANMSFFNEFRQKYLPNITTKEYFYDSDFEQDFPDADLYIVGSDQVWNPWVTNDQVGVFFFSFLKNTTKKRISYAASFGGSKRWIYSKEETEYIHSLIKKFDGIAIRDGESKYILENIFKTQSIEVLDPTFLIDDYDELTNDCPLDTKGSLFCFKFIINDYWADVIKFLGKELKLDIRMDTCLIPFDGLPYKPLCTVNEWLKLIKTSDFVFTDSFHGMVFCILFRKQFIVTPSYAHGEGRYKDLAQKLGLEDRLYMSTDEVYASKDVWTKPIDYDKVYTKLNKLKKDSQSYLLSFIQN